MKARIALRGPIYSGKTTLALRLEEDYGFTIILYADLLKELAVKALTAAGIQGLASAADIQRDKARYRAFLQDLGVLLDFDHGFGIDQLMAEAPAGPLVFDNIRFLDQWLKLKPHGFRLVGLQLDPMEQEKRAAMLGVTREQLGRALAHPAELGFPIQDDELVLDARMPTAELAWLVAKEFGLGVA